MASTTLTSWALLIWNALQDAGIDARVVFSKVGLDPAKLGDGNARYKIEDMQNLWQAAVEYTNDPCFGVETGKRWNSTTFHALGFAWLASASLIDAFGRMERYSRLVNDAISTDLDRAGTNYQFIIKVSESPELVHPAGIDAAMAAIIQMCRMLIGDSFTPIEVHIKGARTVSAVCLETFIHAPVIYDKEDYMLLIDRHDMERALATANTELIRANEMVALQYLAKLDRSNVSMQVKTKIIELLPSGQAREEDVAAALNISLRTMQRKLREQGESFARLLSTMKKEMAENYIQDSQLSINEIAYLLGFSDQANFTRAFRRWNGSTPSEYRLNLRNQSATAR